MLNKTKQIKNLILNLLYMPLGGGEWRANSLSSMVPDELLNIQAHCRFALLLLREKFHLLD